MKTPSPEKQNIPAFEPSNLENSLKMKLENILQKQLQLRDYKDKNQSKYLNLLQPVDTPDKSQKHQLHKKDQSMEEPVENIDGASDGEPNTRR